MLPEPVEVTLLVTGAFDSLGIVYAIGGSMASASYGRVRTTMDVDLVAQLRSEHVEPIVQALGDAFYVAPSTMRAAIDRRSNFNLIHLATMFKVDIFIPKDRPFDRQQLARREKRIIVAQPEMLAYVATAEDTILAKLEWYRLGNEQSERQWRDVQGILEVQREWLDYVYLRHWAVELKVADLLARAIGEAGNQADS